MVETTGFHVVRRTHVLESFSVSATLFHAGDGPAEALVACRMPRRSALGPFCVQILESSCGIKKPRSFAGSTLLPVKSTANAELQQQCCSQTLCRGRTQSGCRCAERERGMSPPRVDGQTHYEVLGVTESCSMEEVKAAYRKLVKETHPDSAQSGGGDAARFSRITQAFRVLSDEHSKQSYDFILKAPRSQGANSSARWGDDAFMHSTAAQEYEPMTRVAPKLMERDSRTHFRAVNKLRRKNAKTLPERIAQRRVPIRSGGIALGYLALPLVGAAGLYGLVFH
ncbi:Chaperone protein DnaJ [Durusdinium trenchii]|uniref:Chaperone protein DnaJ n=1 Tax=Durusdinium trenchii TaxID=1381693 RepID=A0ABP0QZJ4_9DINO